MAMTLRLTDEQNDALRQQAEAEGRSMHAVAQDAIAEYVDRRRHKARVAESVAYVTSTYAAALTRLGEI